MDKILIVDDNAEERQQLKDLLLGYESDSWNIKETVCSKIPWHDIEFNPPDLILLSVRLKNYEVLKQIKSRIADFIPIMIAFPEADKQDQRTAFNLGATEFISKPIDRDEFICRILMQIKIKRMHDDAQWVAHETNKGIKLLYKELEMKNKELQELDQLKSDFISTVSHELRTPLAIIRQGVSLLYRRIIGEINEQQEESLGTVLENIDRLVKIINDLLDISKLESGKVELEREQVDIKEVITKLVKDFKVKSDPKQIILKSILPEEIPFLYADKDKIIQVLINLLGNAVKFTHENGSVTVEAKEIGSSVVISVTDTGIGLSEDNILKLFDKFQQFGRKPGPGEQGTGLGLAISKEIVKLHGGDIWVKSELNKGSMFYFSIPKYETPEEFCAKTIDMKIENISKTDDNKLALIVMHVINMNEVRANGERVYKDVVSSVTDVIKKQISRTGDLVHIYHFDKIMILLPHTNSAGAKIVCEKIEKAIFASSIEVNKQEFDIKFRFGVSDYPSNGDTAKKLLNAAEDEIFRKRKILIIDDHPQIIRLLSIGLESQDRFICIGASDGQEGVDTAIRELPDLIICDILMPNMSGYEVVGQIKANMKTKHIPIIILTALSVETQEFKSLVKGDIPVVTKTDGFEKIVDIVNKYL